MANRVASILSQMFCFGIHRAIVETTPVQLLYRPEGKEKPRARVLSEEELQAFLRTWTMRAVSSAFRTFFACSCSRCSEEASSHWPSGASST